MHFHRLGILLVVLLWTGCDNVQTSGTDTTAPTLELKLTDDQRSFDVTAVSGTPARVAPDRLVDVLFVATAKDAGGIRSIEVEVTAGTILGTNPGGRLRREIPRDQARGEARLGTRIATKSGPEEIRATAEDFQGNSVTAYAQANFPTCETVSISSPGGNLQDEPSDEVEYYSSGDFKPATKNGIRIPAGITRVTNLGNRTILLRLFDLNTWFAQWADPLPVELAAGAGTAAYNGQSRTNGWWIVEYPGGPVDIEVCSRSPVPPSTPL